jgi:hypothetical protein
MMTLRSRRTMWVTTLAVVLAIFWPGVAMAQDDGESSQEPPPVLGEVNATLPVLGSGLDVTIARDDKGHIESVSLDPSDGVTQVKDGDHRVVFLLGDGDTKVIVKSGHGGVQTKVKADDPADVSGDGVWTGDVFGTGVVTVPYTIAFDGNTPIITVGAITAPADVTFEIGEPKVRASEDGQRAFSKVKVKLTSGDDDAVLVLAAKLKTNDEGETRVSVSTTLRDRGRWDWHDHDRDRDDKWDRDRDDDSDRNARWDNDHDRGDKWDRGDKGDRDEGRDRDHDDSGRGDGDDA